MKSLAAVACTSFAVGYASSTLYYHIKEQISKNSRGLLNEVHFTCPSSACCVEESKPDCRNPNCKARNEKRLIELIEAAKHTVLLAMYIFTSKRLCDAIVAAHNRGVRVLIIGCRSMAYSSGSQMALLAKLNIPVRFPFDTQMLVHHKFVLIDTKSPPTSTRSVASTTSNIELPPHGVLISGSMNWTIQALSGNWDNFIITSEAKLVEPFVKEFIKIWNNFHPENSQKRPVR